MAVRYIYNTAGEYVAFIMNGNLFSPDCDWLGFIVSGNELYDTSGGFIGYVMDDDRVVRNRHDVPKPRRPHPVRPPRPLRPLRPLRRWRKPRMPFPYDDVFEAGPAQESRQLSQAAPDFSYLEGATLVAGNGQFLGVVSRNRFEHTSLANQVGPHGSQYSSTSIFNQYCPYGGQFGAFSPFNAYSSTPPRIVRGVAVVGLLSVNTSLSQHRIDPNDLVRWIQREV